MVHHLNLHFQHPKKPKILTAYWLKQKYFCQEEYTYCSLLIPKKSIKVLILF